MDGGTIVLFIVVVSHWPSRLQPIAFAVFLLGGIKGLVGLFSVSYTNDALRIKVFQSQITNLHF